MKRWQLEQILYLNDLKKTKLILPEKPDFKIRTSSNIHSYRENIFRRKFRHIFAAIVNAL